MLNKILMILLGITLFALGLGIILDPEFYDTKHQFHYDFSDIRLPFGGFLVAMGSIFIFIALKKKAKDLEPKILICAKCLKPLYQQEMSNNKCPECDGELEELDGFYERHPELKEKE